MGLAHEINQTASVTYIEGVSHGLNVDSYFEFFEKKEQKREKGRIQNTGARRQEKNKAKEKKAEYRTPFH